MYFFHLQSAVQSACCSAYSDQICTFQCIIPTGDANKKYDRHGRESPSGYGALEAVSLPLTRSSFRLPTIGVRVLDGQFFSVPGPSPGVTPHALSVPLSLSFRDVVCLDLYLFKANICRLSRPSLCNACSM